MLRRIAASVLAVALVAGLAGCSFLENLSEGQRITNERLRVADALRILVGQLESLDAVDRASYHFDAIDVTSTPGVAVELTSVDAGGWREAVRLIEEAAGDEPLSEHSLAAALSSGAVTAQFDTEWGSAWLHDDSIGTAARLVELFPEARIAVGGGGESTAFISLSATETAEELLARVTGDEAVLDLVGGLDPARVAVEFRAAGLSLSGSLASPEAAAWATGILSRELPRHPAGSDGTPVDEWVLVTIGAGIEGSGLGTTLGIELVGATELATGPAWEQLLEVLATPVPEFDGPGICVPLQIMYAWPGVQGNWPSFTNECVEWENTSGDPDRPSLVALREALAASGIDLDALGYTLS
ncbi:hypothetical protein H4J02_01000 [Protaetiibacter sp. SSC-01]|uniref:hypothetical protein n=1 Tax=Protaetiibacter sp. SSC-01 TaxID=2759943 RepID=UPI001656AF63|nr:hypothetical protein [Protaetiibacter sp. SSC-01]QNO37656.1 hypothetical protein H4J02_01000 [Protaetiibacter sp. SSC-01]